MKLGCHKQMAR